MGQWAKLRLLFKYLYHHLKNVNSFFKMKKTIVNLSAVKSGQQAGLEPAFPSPVQASQPFLHGSHLYMCVYVLSNG